jgi:hypothetical protein
MEAHQHLIQHDLVQHLDPGCGRQPLRHALGVSTTPIDQIGHATTPQ